MVQKTYKTFECPFKKYYLLMYLLMSSTYGYSQTQYHIAGKVSYNNGTLIKSGDVQLLTATDSILVKYSDVTNGNFSFEKINPGNYLIRVSYIGYKDEIKSVSLKSNAYVLFELREDPQNLKVVQISTGRKVFSNHLGNMKVEIENSILAKVADPISLLSKLPSVQLSPDKERINIIGQGEPLIYLDQQKITLNELNSLSTSDIKSIEIISNPSVKYEAEGRTVLLITRSRKKAEGLNAVLAETASFKTYLHNRSSLNLNYKKNKLELRSNIQYNHLNLWESNSNDFRIPDKDIASDYTVLSVGPRKQLTVGGGLYYEINDNDYLSFNISNRWQNEDFINTADTYIKQPGETDNVFTDNRNKNTRPLFNSSFNYNKKLKATDGQLFIATQFSTGSQGLTSNIYNNYNNTQAVLTQIRNQGYKVQVFSGRVDYEQSFAKALKWESGLAVTSAQSNSFLELQTYDPLTLSNSDYKYDEQLLSAYTQLSGKLGKLNFSAGLRTEDTQTRGYGENNTAVIQKDYINFFPKTELRWTADENTSLGLNYAKSISRPNYASSSQITTYINPFFEWANNINIDPTIKDELTVAYQYQQSSLSLSYYRIKNPVYYAIDYDDQLDRLRMVNTNYKLETGLNLTLTIPFKYKLLTSTNELTGVLNQVKDPLAVINKSMPYLYLYSNNQLALPGNYSLMISGWAYTKRIEGVFERNAMYAIDFMLSKTFFKNLSCTAGYNSLLSTRTAREDFTINDISSRGLYYLDVREFTIGLKYSIGGLRHSNYKNKAVDDSINRL